MLSCHKLLQTTVRKNDEPNDQEDDFQDHNEEEHYDSLLFAEKGQAVVAHGLAALYERKFSLLLPVMMRDVILEERMKVIEE